MGIKFFDSNEKIEELIKQAKCKNRCELADFFGVSLVTIDRELKIQGIKCISTAKFSDPKKLEELRDLLNKKTRKELSVYFGISKSRLNQVIIDNNLVEKDTIDFDDPEVLEELKSRLKENTKKDTAEYYNISLKILNRIIRVNNIEYESVKGFFNRKRNLDKLKELAKSKTRSELAKYFGLSIGPIDIALKKYNIRCKKENVSISTEEEMSEFKELAKNNTIKELMEYYNLSYSTIVIKLDENNITCKSTILFGNKEDIVKLKRIAPYKTREELAEYYKVSITTIDRNLLKNNIKCKLLNKSYFSDVNKVEELKKLVLYKNKKQLMKYFGVSYFVLNSAMEVNNIKYNPIKEFRNDKDIKELRKFAEGKTLQDLLKYYNVSEDILKIILEKEGIKYKKNAFLSDEERDKFIRFATNKTVSQIAKYLNISASDIREILKDEELEDIILTDNNFKFISVKDIAKTLKIDEDIILKKWVKRGFIINNGGKVLSEFLEGFLKSNQDLWSAKDLEYNAFYMVEEEWLKEKRKRDYFVVEDYSEVDDRQLEILLLSQKGLLISEISKSLDISREEVASCIGENKDKVDMEFVSTNRVAAICEVDISIVNHCFKNKGLIVEEISSGKRYCKTDDFIRFINNNDNLGINKYQVNKILNDDINWVKVKSKVGRE